MAYQDYQGARVQGSSLHGGNGQYLRSFYRKGAKRFFDVTFVLLTLPITLLLVLFLLCLVALDGRNPLYVQKRIGLNGRVFHMFKIRTMVAGAETLLEEHLNKNPDARREWDETQKLKCDPRITRIGLFFRKSSLDELPQLWNVLKGDMSLVGPRPMMVEQEALYPGTAYFQLRPGLTGLWQVSDRNKTSFAERASFDSRYFSMVSFPQDLSILFRTVKVVMRGTGY